MLNISKLDISVWPQILRTALRKEDFKRCLLLKQSGSLAGDAGRVGASKEESKRTLGSVVG